MKLVLILFAWLLTYAYDARGQVSSVSDSADSGNGRFYSYDPNGRLLNATGPWGAGSFVYDALSNLRAQTLGGRQIAINYDSAKNRVASVTDTANPARSLAYDARGNTTNDGRNAFAYDHSNQPTGSSTAGHTYAYDGNFKRAKFIRAGATFYDAYSRVTGKLAYRDNAAAGLAFEIETVGPLSVAFLGGAFDRYHHLDHLGTRVASTDAAGAVLERERFTPFGEQIAASRYNNFPLGFTGHSRDSGTNLNYMQARFYDPVIGRFLSTDPIGYQDQLNLYAYVGNDPVNATDPTGEFCVPCLGAAVGFVAEAISIGVDVAGGRDVSLAEGAARLGTSTVLGAVGAGIAGRAISAVAGAGIKAVGQKAAINAAVSGVANGANTAARGGIQVAVTGETDITAGDVAKDVAIGGAAALGGQALSEGVEALGKAAGALSKGSDLAAGGTVSSRALAPIVEGAANAVGVNAPSFVPEDDLEKR